MKHPEIFLLPALMLADYFLTVYSAILLERKYQDFFKVDQHELNPAFQNAIANKKWFNTKHLSTTVLFTASFVFLFEIDLLPDVLVEGIMGALLIIYAIVVRRHLINILLARWIIRNPTDVSGAVTMSHRYSLNSSLFSGIGDLLLIAFLVIFNPTPFLVGSLIG
ncbi:MAG TPA: hypothetical protein PKG95_14025, partial [Anaerolineaceae bacterium]|nr:hypothetical protein [Anaerolineaceae bacterium]